MESRRRRVQSALASRTGAAAQRAAWVDAQFPAADFENVTEVSGNAKQLSPAAAENRRVAARLPAGFSEMVVEALTEERQALERRLSALSAACSTAQTQPAAASACSAWRSPAGKAGALAAGVSLSDSAGGGKGTVSTAVAGAAGDRGARGHGGASSPGAQSLTFSTPRRPATPPTVARPTPAGPGQAPGSPAVPPAEAAQAAAPATLVGRGGRGPTSNASSSTPAVLGRPATPSEARPWDATPPLAGASAAVGVRRQLFSASGTPASLPPPASPPGAAAGAGPALSADAVAPSYVVGGVGLLELRQRLQRTAAAPAPITAEALTVARQAAAAGSSVAAGAAVAALDGLLGVAPPPPQPGPYLQRLYGPSWLDPVDLLRPHGSLIKFEQGRSGSGPLTADLHVRQREQYEYEGSHLSSRERLRAGIADLNAELHSSWRAMVESGAV
ncbi:hypothetical protein HYH02_000625 [Chlamydomonas schloesseri]|uniref:Uncharacterized protein n=1 Tax=Chlamydomonas schloesseri TaxID=2026947 RepID=A0A836BDM0_9CHLO|nr:hypothetical protein HYH02_000625 [Chlamydomonas schloesseri]|eukprot:KAG2454790.1 hypothetical protein HYH02_000625 [Chlamydomonas schloesseri]